MVLDNVVNAEVPFGAVLLAAGRGKRMRPYTDSIPKSLLRYNNTPIIGYILDALKFANIKKLYIVTNYLEAQIISYVSEKYGNEFDITFCHQENITGSANAVLTTSEYMKEELYKMRSILISATDYYMPINCIRDLIMCHSNNKSDISVSLRTVSKNKIKSSSVAIIDHHDNLAKIIEKPEDNYIEPVLAASLLYIVPTQIINYLGRTPLSKRGEHELPDVINMMIDDGHFAKGCRQPEIIDIGDLAQIMSFTPSNANQPKK